MSRASLVLLCFLASSIVLASPETDRPQLLLPSQELPEPIVEQARRLLAALRVHEVNAVQHRIDLLVAMRKAALIQNLTPVAAAFVARFRAEARSFDPEDAIGIARKAIDLAPDFPPLYFNLANTYVTHNPKSIGPCARAFFEGVRAFYRYPRGLITSAGNIAIRMAFALALMLVILCTMILFRHVRLLGHDIGDLFPAGPSRGFSAAEVARSRRARLTAETGIARTLGGLVTGLLLFMPIVLGAGLVATGLIWLLLIAPYLRKAGEVAASAFAFLTAALIGPLAFLSGLPVALQDVPGPKLWACVKEVCSPSDDIAALLQRNPQDAQAALALSIGTLRQNPTDPETLAKALTPLEQFPRDEKARLLRAETLLLLALATCERSVDQKYLMDAIPMFEGLATHPTLAAPALRGLALAQGLIGERDAMERALASLAQLLSTEEFLVITQIRAAAARENLCQDTTSVRAILLPPPADGLSLYLHGVTLASVPTPVYLGGVFLGHFTPRALSLLAVALLPIWVFALRLPRRRNLAQACPRCGEVTCSACNVRASGFDYCPSCLLEQVRPAFIDPLDIAAMERHRERFAKTRGFAVSAVALLLPGGGQLLAGRTLRGFVLLGLFVLTATFVALPLPLYTDAVGFTGPPSGPLPALPPAFLAVIYFLSALDVWLSHRR